MPLIPEPFPGISISRQSVFSRIAPITKTWGGFCPNLNIPQYRETLSEEKKKELDNRASRVYKRAGSNFLCNSSEFSWEVSAWQDVFGLIYDDERLRMLVLSLFALVPVGVSFD